MYDWHVVGILPTPLMSSLQGKRSMGLVSRLFFIANIVFQNSSKEQFVSHLIGFEDFRVSYVRLTNWAGPANWDNHTNWAEKYLEFPQIGQFSLCERNRLTLLCTLSMPL